MGKISEIFNFDDIGGKIKNLAKWSCWITILLIWITAPISFIVLASADWSAEHCWIPLVGAIVGPIFVWYGSWAMYAFGEFVEDTHAIRNKYYPTEEEKAQREAEKEQLSKSDIEDAASNYLKRRVSVSDINCTLIYVIPKNTGKPKEMHLDMSVGDTEFTSLDLFFDPKRKAYFFKDRQLALDSAWRSVNEIFGFDVSLFKKFNTGVDEDE